MPTFVQLGLDELDRIPGFVVGPDGGDDFSAAGGGERDEVEDLARRKGMELRAAERWLGPILNYDPGELAEVAA